MLYIISTFIMAAIVGSGLSQECPDVQTKQNFDPNQYSGRWFEERRIPAIFQADGKCVTADYSIISPTEISVRNRQIDRSGKPKTIEGTAKVISDGKLEVTFPSVPMGAGGNYWVLDTDYKNYAVVYSCGKKGVFKYEFAWILTRNEKPAKSVVDKAIEVLRNNNIDVDKMKVTEQNDCDYD